LKQGLAVADRLTEVERNRLAVQLLVQIELHLSGCKGLASICAAYESCHAEQYPQAFIHASHAVWNYTAGQVALNRVATGQWESFYRCDWLTSIAGDREAHLPGKYTS
jgi:uncharacterized protein YceK